MPKYHLEEVILDTDVGGDIDDAWALAFLLKLHILTQIGRDSEANRPPF